MLKHLDTFKYADETKLSFNIFRSVLVQASFMVSPITVTRIYFTLSVTKTQFDFTCSVLPGMHSKIYGKYCTTASI